MKNHWMTCAASALSLALGACSPPVTPAQDSGVPGADAQSEAAVSMPDASTSEDAASTGDSATSQDAAAAPVGSCQQMVGTLSYCIDYTGTGPTAEFVQMACSMTMGTYAATPCATMNRVGRCTLEGATAVLTQTASYYAPTTVQEATMALTHPHSRPHENRAEVHVRATVAVRSSGREAVARWHRPSCSPRSWPSFWTSASGSARRSPRWSPRSGSRVR